MREGKEKGKGEKKETSRGRGKGEQRKRRRGRDDGRGRGKRRGKSKEASGRVRGKRGRSPGVRRKEFMVMEGSCGGDS